MYAVHFWQCPWSLSRMCIFHEPESERIFESDGFVQPRRDFASRFISVPSLEVCSSSSTSTVVVHLKTRLLSNVSQRVATSTRGLPSSQAHATRAGVRGNESQGRGANVGVIYGLNADKGREIILQHIYVHKKTLTHPPKRGRRKVLRYSISIG